MNKKSESVMRSQKRKKIKAIEAFGSKCCMCGYDKCIEALEFHHLNKNEKEEKPSKAILSWSFERAKTELDKCILVCANCHREIHAAEKENKPLDLQNYYRPWLNITCECCFKEFSTKNKKQKFCTVSCSNISNCKVLRPDKKTLKNLIELHNWTDLGKMFGVSDNAVRKWAKKYLLI